MQQIKVGVVEDEILIADNICFTLLNLGYKVAGPVISYTDAIEMIEEQTPDLLLLDIQLAGSADGIELAAHVQQTYGIPYIFLTANSDQATVKRATQVQPYAFLVKPFTSDEIYAAIEIAMANFEMRRTKPEPINSVSDPFIFVKQGQAYHKLMYKNITYAQSVENYVLVFTNQNKRFIIRSTFQQFLLQFTEEQLFRLHRSYAINPTYIESIDATDVIINGTPVPMHKAEKEKLLQLIGK